MKEYWFTSCSRVQWEALGTLMSLDTLFWGTLLLLHWDCWDFILFFQIVKNYLCGSTCKNIASLTIKSVIWTETKACFRERTIFLPILTIFHSRIISHLFDVLVYNFATYFHSIFVYFLSVGICLYLGNHELLVDWILQTHI